MQLKNLEKKKQIHTQWMARNLQISEIETLRNTNPWNKNKEKKQKYEPMSSVLRR